MNYEMEELLPLVGRLAEKYTGLEHTSITYERAERLMEAVLYCIREGELSEENFLALSERRPAREAYELGVAAVERKTREALEIYNQMLPNFQCYENRCLYDTFVKGLPEFFKWYDIRFAPQETLLTLDYPLLKDLSGLAGIDRIYEFIRCVRLEQEFLQGFPGDSVRRMLSRHDRSYRSMVENLCEIVYGALVRHMLVKKPLAEEDWGEEETLQLKEILTKTELTEPVRLIEQRTAELVENYYGANRELTEYLSTAIGGILTWLKQGALWGNPFAAEAQGSTSESEILSE